MSEPETCGDLGGRTKSGTPCQNPARGGKKCRHHRSDRDNPNHGRPAHEPTEMTRRFVQTCVMGGITQEEIAQAIGITRPTLRKHYRDTLDDAYTKANAKVVQTLFQMATSGKDTSATIFWLKARLGWSEKLDVTSDGDKIDPSVVLQYPNDSRRRDTPTDDD